MVVYYYSVLKRAPLHQFFAVTLVGVAIGGCIYKQLLEKYVGKLNSMEKTDAVSSDGSAVSPLVSRDVKPTNTSSSAATKTSTPAKKKDVTGALLIRVKGKDNTASSSE